MHPTKQFTEEDFQIKVTRPELEIGLEAVLWGNKGKIIRLEGTGHSEPYFSRKDYVLVELDKPDKNGCKFIEVRKEIFNIVQYPITR